MAQQKQVRLQRFTTQVQNDPRLAEKVSKWLAKNPPPHDWQASRIEWAYLEMPCTTPYEGVMDLLLGRGQNA